MSHPLDSIEPIMSAMTFGLLPEYNGAAMALVIAGLIIVRRARVKADAALKRFMSL